jgi:hypothetical protein
MSSLSRSPEELTPAFLTDALRSCGALADGNAVASFEWTRVGEGAGFIGVIARLWLAYGGDAAGAPATIIAKFPSPDEGARTIGNLYGLFEREVHFYKDVAGRAGIYTARCYYAAWDGAAGQSLLLLEDLALHGEIGDQLAGCSAAEAMLAITELAKFHAAWSDPAKLEAVPWLQDGVDLVRMSMTQVYPQSWQPCLDLFGARLSPDVCAVIPGLDSRIMRLLDEDLADVPMNIIHGDYRLDNLFFGRDGAPYRLAAVDWQSPNRAWGAYDAAYFLSGSMPPAERRACEPAALRAYHDTLVQGGVRGYPFERFHDDYRRSLLVYLAIFVVNGATLEMTNQRAVDLFGAIFDRLNAAIVDLDALALLR